MNYGNAISTDFIKQAAIWLALAKGNFEQGLEELMWQCLFMHAQAVYTVNEQQEELQRNLERLMPKYYNDSEEEFDDRPY